MATIPVNFTLPYLAPQPLLLCDGSQPETEFKVPQPEQKHTPQHEPQYRASGHMMDFLIPSRYQEFITLACRALRGYDFDAIAFSGMSGALIGPPVALALGKSMILVRKPDDDTHSCHRVEGDRNTRRYVILDDFVCSGDTKKRIVEGVKGFAPDAEFLGLLSVTYLDERELERHQGSLFPLRFAGEV